MSDNFMHNIYLVGNHYNSIICAGSFPTSLEVLSSGYIVQIRTHFLILFIRTCYVISVGTKLKLVLL